MLTLIAGPMFSGKTSALIQLVRRVRAADGSVVVFGPPDVLLDGNRLAAHNGDYIQAYPLDREDFSVRIRSATHVVVDEAQFLSADVVSVLLALRSTTDLTLAGLDRDFRGNGFGSVPRLLRQADRTLLLRGICGRCGARPSTRTQRLDSHGRPASLNGPIVLIGGEESYGARCKPCYFEERGLIGCAVRRPT
jgi:thymidine kinase